MHKHRLLLDLFVSMFGPDPIGGTGYIIVIWHCLLGDFAFTHVHPCSTLFDGITTDTIAWRSAKRFRLVAVRCGTPLRPSLKTISVPVG